MFLPCTAKIERHFWDVILGRQIILERLGVLVNLLCLSLKSACTKVEFSRVELLKLCPPFTPYFVQNLTYLRTKTRNAKGYRCNHLSWYVSATWLSEPNFHDMHAGTWQNILVVDGSLLADFLNSLPAKQPFTAVLKMVRHMICFMLRDPGKYLVVIVMAFYSRKDQISLGKFVSLWLVV